MSTKTIYAYNNDGEYIGETLAYEDPMRKGHYPLPYNSTEIKPPEAGANQIPIFNNDKWALVDDYRGQVVYDITNGNPKTIEEVGAITGYTTTPPNGKYLKFLKGKWVKRPLTKEEQDRENQNQIMELKQYLAETDYVVLKIAEGEADKNDYTEVLKKRKAVRTEINKLAKESK